MRTRGRSESLSGLGFDDYSVIDHHVEALPGDELTLVVNRDHHLTVDLVSAQRQLVLERAGVGGLAQSTTAKVVVHGEERGNDRVHAFRFEELAAHGAALKPTPLFPTIIRFPSSTRDCSLNVLDWIRFIRAMRVPRVLQAACSRLEVSAALNGLYD